MPEGDGLGLCILTRSSEMRIHRLGNPLRADTGCEGAGGFRSVLNRIPDRGRSDGMKTTVDIPEDELRAAMRFTRAKTKREAVITALRDFNRRQRMAKLARHFASSDTFMTHAELIKLRQMS